MNLNRNILAKGIGASVLALSLAVLPSTLSASATTDTTDPNVPGGTTTTPETLDTAETDGGFDWGWLGLLGLIGLAGLKGRDRSDNVQYSDQYRDRDRVTTSTTDPRY